MKLPDFLIVGAMKAGTTTMYFALQRSPDVYMPSTKDFVHAPRQPAQSKPACRKRTLPGEPCR